MNEILPAALSYSSLAYRLIPLIGKRPFLRDWCKCGSLEPDQIHNWFSTNHNIGILSGSANRIVIVDLDTKQAARRYFNKFQSVLKSVCVTRRGLHCYWQLPEGEEIRSRSDSESHCDLRGENSQCVCPPSMVNGHKYFWLPGYELVTAQELPVYCPEYGPPQKKRQPVHSITQTPMSSEAMMHRALSYVCRIKSISGEGGHNAAFRVACLLFQRFNLSRSDSETVFAEWNQLCASPPWSKTQCEHKLDDSYHIYLEGKQS